MIKSLGDLKFQDIYFRNNTYSRFKIISLIDHLASYLKKNTHSDSPFIMLATFNHIKTIIAYYAILKIGKIAVIIDPKYKTFELIEIISDSDPAAIIFINSNTLNFDYEEEIVFRKTNPKFEIQSDLADVCTLIYTNAEDGHAKAAMLTKKNLIAEINIMRFCKVIEDNSISCILLPFHHAFGLLEGILVPTHSYSSLLIVDIDLYKFESIINEIFKYKITHFVSIPSVYYLMSKIPDIGHHLKFMNKLSSGGYKLPSLVFNNFFNRTGKKIHEGYGLTEAAPGCIMHSHLEDEIKIESIGKALPCCEIKIVDKNNNKCMLNETGEICIKGDNIFKGYFNKEHITKKVLIDGWLHSGDMGSIDEKNYIYFKGLKKKMINVGGINVYPKELERLMKLNKNVTYVKITNQNSLIQGEIVIANIKLKKESKNARELFKNWCYENITNSKLPKIWNFIN